MKIDYNEPIKFIGNSYVNIDYHDGQLNHAIGVNSVQVLRANRENPDGLRVPVGLIITRQC